MGLCSRRWRCSNRPGRSSCTAGAGADRTGTVVACYRIAHDHWDNRKALGEARQFGMSWVQRAMHHYVMNYKAPMQAASAPPAAAVVN